MIKSSMAETPYRMALMPQTNHISMPTLATTSQATGVTTMQAKDVLPDGQNQIHLAGTVVRKGTVGAFLLNARVWLDPAATAAQRQQVAADMQDALPALQALGLFDVLEIRDPALRHWLASHPLESA
ncbi:hypothetical protein HNQ50_001607 [Silvimonas terrae]|uniref:Preprotein translocase subunit SecD n=1 Tax=Silvimonas terrae TaxID=300266 RepID=A0A840RE66_9NEIS|nr:hypothetical protein [Silvimonas terrae]MBB5190884.1 hypothetical protein [Silvimonas terrae]